MDCMGRRDGVSERQRELLHIVEAEMELVAEFVRMLPPLAAMDMAAHLGLIRRTLDGLRRRL